MISIKVAEARMAKNATTMLKIATSMGGGTGGETGPRTEGGATGGETGDARTVPPPQAQQASDAVIPNGDGYLPYFGHKSKE